MKKLVVFILFFLFPLLVQASEKIDVYLFYSLDCPHCKNEKEFLLTLSEKENIDIHLYEVVYNSDNKEKFLLVQEVLNAHTKGIPYTVIGSKHFIGFSSEVENNLKATIDNYQSGVYIDFVSKIFSKEITKENISQFYKQEKITDDEANNRVTIPLLGKINPSTASMGIIAVIMGLVDGFNPCAMWVLIFLLSMLITLKDQKKMWILGITFLLTSALLYMLFMISWLSIIINFVNVKIIQLLIALISLAGSFLNFKSYFRKKQKDAGCDIVDEKKRKKIFTRIRKFTNEKNIIFALLGVVFLAISVNIVELACSAGLPVIFTNILAINNLVGIKAFSYILLYILFFLLDDIIIFTIAMFTFKVSGMTTKYTKYSHLVGAIIMFLIGILLIFKPQWIMLNF